MPVNRMAKAAASGALVLTLFACGKDSSGKPADPATQVEQQMVMVRAIEEKAQKLVETGDHEPSPEELRALLASVPGVTSTGLGSPPFAWAELGDGGPLYWLAVNLPGTVASSSQQRAPPERRGELKAETPSSEVKASAWKAKEVAVYQGAFYGVTDNTDRIAAQFESKGYHRVGAAASVEELRTFQNVKTLYIETHGGHAIICRDEKFRIVPDDARCRARVAMFGMFTTSTPPQTPPWMWPPALLEDVTQGRLGYMTALVYPVDQPKRAETHFAVTPGFVRRYWSFTDESLFYLDSCFSSASDMRSALFEKNLTTYLGWDNVSLVGPAGVFFFDRYLGLNQEKPEPDPPQRPFDPDSVLAEMKKLGKDTTTTPDGTVAHLLVFHNPGGGPQTAGVVSIGPITILPREKKLEAKGIFGTDPGPDRRKVKLGGTQLHVKEGGWTPESIEADLPEGSHGGEVVIATDDLESNPVQVTEWAGTFRMEGRADFVPLGFAEGTAIFNLRFRADVHRYRQEAGEEPMRKELVLFKLEDDSTMSWNGRGEIAGQTRTFSGTTGNLIELDYGNPDWMFTLPQQNFIAGEGYIDVTNKKLFLFLAGVGDDQGWGTFAALQQTDCPYDVEWTRMQQFFVFDLDDQFGVADGSCTNRIVASDGQGGGFFEHDTRSWQLATTSPPSEDAPR